jgi:FixJ family two-component response regulator
LPIIIVTAFPEAKVRAQALAAGALGFLSKPFSDENLIMYLDQALAARSGLTQPGNFNRRVGTRSCRKVAGRRNRALVALVETRRVKLLFKLAGSRASQDIADATGQLYRALASEGWL